MKPQINKFGFEIEGEMTDEMCDELVEYGEVKADGSLYSCKTLKDHEQHHPVKNLYCNEFASIPYKYDKKGIKQAEELISIFEKYYKEKEYHWNKSMGMHIHVSFKPRTPVDIWSLQFAEHFYKKMKKTFPEAYEKRRTNREYCKIVRNKKEICEDDNRYVAINYKSALNKFGTVEFRIFPADEPEKMKEYLHFTLSLIDEFMENSSKYLNEKHELELDETEEGNVRTSNLKMTKKDYPENYKEVKEKLEIKIRTRTFGENKNIIKDLRNLNKGEKVDYLEVFTGSSCYCGECYNCLKINMYSAQRNMHEQERARIINPFGRFYDTTLYDDDDVCECGECGECEDRWNHEYENCDCGSCGPCESRYQWQYDWCECGDCEGCRDRYDHDYHHCDCDRCQACEDRWQSNYDNCECEDCEPCIQRARDNEENQE